MPRKKKEQTTKKWELKDGFDPKTGKFDTGILLKMFPDARYYFVLGGRGWGKTYPTIRLAIDDAMDGKGVFAYVRRYKESISDTFIQDLMAPHAEHIEQKSNNIWNRLGYWRKRWTLEQWGWREHRGTDEPTWERLVKADQPIAGAFAMNTWETSKGPDFAADKGGIKHIIFDEAVSAGGDYLHDEWGKFQNVISSLVRENWEKDTKIWLLANPVSKYTCPYFRNMGITKDMMSKPGVTQIVYPKEPGAKKPMTAVFCYLGEKEEDTKSLLDAKDLTYQTFFAFPNSKGKSKSITHGTWELEDAMQLPSKVYNDSDEVKQTFFKMDEDILGCKIMRHCASHRYYLFFYPASKIKEKTYYFTLVPTLDKYAIIGLKTGHPLSKVLNDIFQTHQVFYADNSAADLFHGWMLEASKVKY